MLVTLRYVPETRAPSEGRFDVPGAVLAAVSLGSLTYWLIEWHSSLAVPALVLGLVAGAAFLLVEHRTPSPMLPLELFSSRVFSAANAMTLLVYAALGAILFFLVIDLQTVLGYGALAAGLSTLPITVIMLLLAARGGALGTRIGPRIPMTVGPLVMALGVAWLSRLDGGSSYWTAVLPPLVVFSLGLALMVAPLTMTVLAAASDERAGIASGVNNAVARAGSLFAVAALPVAVGLSGDQYDQRGGVQQCLPVGPAHLRRAAGRRRTGVVGDHPGRTARSSRARGGRTGAGAGGGAPARLPAARPLSTRELPCLHAGGGGSDVAHACVRCAGAGRLRSRGSR